MNALDNPVAELRLAGQNPDRALLDRVTAIGPSLIPLLIEMATDERLHRADQESPAVWAPIHAIQLLGELRAVEAVHPLLPLYTWDDDDYLAEVLPEAFGLIGGPALPAMEALLTDGEKTVWTRLRAASTLTKIAQQVPEYRNRVVATLAASLDSAVPRMADDDTFTGFVIGELLTLSATEALPAIEAAFADDRVDPLIVDGDDVASELGLTDPLPGERRRPNRLPRSIAPPEGAFPWARPSGFSMRVRPIGSVGRNAPCPCGSGKKYKKCCGA